MTTYARNTLALDLGMNTGWSVLNRDGDICHGTVKFLNLNKAHPGERWAKFRVWLAGILDNHQIHCIAYEDVRRHEGTRAAHVYGAFRALLEMTAGIRNIPLRPVGVGVVKKHWTGKGNAGKQEMIAEARRRGFNPDTDNAADALAILHWVQAQA